MKKYLLIGGIILIVGGTSWIVWARSSPVPTMTVKVYFANNTLDPEITCEKVFPITRTIPRTQTVGTAAIVELLKGPTAADQARGYITTLPSGVHLESLTIANGIATASFNEALEYQVGGSCRVSFIRRQITATLEQFPTVRQVIISIDGRTEDILQP